MFCNKCGKGVGDPDDFCRGCGSPVMKDLPGTRAYSSRYPWLKGAFVSFVVFGLFAVGTYLAFPLLEEGKEVRKLGEAGSRSEAGAEVIEETVSTTTEPEASLPVPVIETRTDPEPDLSPSLPETEEYELYTTNAIYEMEPYIEPVGYFTKPEFFDVTSISDEKWFSYIKYHPVKREKSSSEDSANQFPNQRDVFSSVVKIICEDSNYMYFGSGTNMTKHGYILTNKHVVEGDLDGTCMVGFPDPNTGLIQELYWATSVIDEENVTEHDLSYLLITEPVFDEAYNVYGYHEKIDDGDFPYFESLRDCRENALQLGDRLFVIGYPRLGGYALTITDGLISSLHSPRNYVVTSAKIVSGNSGGLAVDKQGCYVGVPTAAYVEEGEEILGEVINGEFAGEFFDAVTDDIAEYQDSK